MPIQLDYAVTGYPPIRRRLLRLLALAAMGLAMALGVTWVRSYWVYDELRVSGDRRVDIGARHGIAFLLVESKFSGETGGYNYRDVVPGDRLWQGDRYGRRVETFHIPIRGEDAPRRGFLGFEFVKYDSTRGEGFFQRVRTVGWAVNVPLWLPAATSALVAILALRRLRNARRHEPPSRARPTPSHVVPPDP